MGPGPGDAAHHAVSATAEGEPPTAGHFVGEAMQGLDRGPLTVDRQFQVRERVLVMRVAPALGDEDIRGKGAHGTGYDGMKGPQPTRIVSSWRQRDVDGGPHAVTPTKLGRHARAWEERPRVLMQADGQDPRVVVERGLNAVAVVHVDVDIGDPLRAARQQPSNPKYHVVENAESRGIAAHRVMQTAGEIQRVLDGTRGHCVGGDQGATGNQRRCVVHTAEDGIIIGAKPVAAERRIFAGRLNRIEVVSVMGNEQLLARRPPGRDDLNVVQYPELTGERDRELEPDRVQRMVAEVIAEDPRVPDDAAAATHQLSAWARSAIRSSASSMPTDSRTRSPGTSSMEPATLACVIRPGCSMSDSTPPSDSPNVNSDVSEHNFSAASSPPRKANDTMPPKPRICRAATS